jgi:hypothetical protein
MDMQMRKALKQAMWKRYRKAPKRMKTKILDELCTMTGYHRQYAIAQLNLMEDAEPLLAKIPRTRKRHYTKDVLAVIEKIWEEADYPWSVRLKGILELWMPWIRRRYALTSLQETKILRIGARTIDRYLASRKRDLRKRLYGRTKPGTLLRHQIPIKCESWDEIDPGHLELDTVSHSGENSSGTFAYTLNLTDIASTWVETRSVLGKSETAILDAFRQMQASLPFPVLSIDSDNGGEFINNRLYGYCQRERIGFTRSRPYKKDDNAHIEQKNWTHVRKIIGWDRYDTPEAVRAMNDLYTQELRLYMNLFQPSVKLRERVRKGSRRTRRYDPPLTALDRLLKMPGIDTTKIEPLVQLRARLDPFALSATIRRKLDRLWGLRTKRRISDRAADPGQETAEVKTIAQSLARRMEKKRKGSNPKNAPPQAPSLK